MQTWTPAFATQGFEKIWEQQLCGAFRLFSLLQLQALLHRITQGQPDPGLWKISQFVGQVTLIALEKHIFYEMQEIV